MGAVVLLGVRAGGLVHFGVPGGPPLAADVAKLVPALAGHVVAALRFLYDHLAAAALAVVQIVLQVAQFVLVALVLMPLQVAFCAVLLQAATAEEAFLFVKA